MLKKIAVLYGGFSPEREVSLTSGPVVIAALKAAGYEVVPFQLDTVKDVFTAVDADVDGYFIALHGGWGENGGIQSLLELRGKVFSGPNAQACCLSMDKWASKASFEIEGVPTPHGIVARASRWHDGDLALLEEAFDRYGSLVIKPNDGGSTVATTIVKKREQILPALHLSWGEEDRALVEAFIPGREVTVGIYDNENGEPVALPVVEIIPNSEFYDYKAKYSDGGSVYQVPAHLTADQTDDIQRTAVEAYKALNCDGYARADIRLSPDDVPYVLELNTAPGMTSHSLVPMAARAAGIQLPDFLRLVLSRAENRVWKAKK